MSTWSDQYLHRWIFFFSCIEIILWHFCFIFGYFNWTSAPMHWRHICFYQNFRSHFEIYEFTLHLQIRLNCPRTPITLSIYSMIFICFFFSPAPGRHNCLLKHQMTFAVALLPFQVLYLKLNLLTWRWHQNYMFCINKLHEKTSMVM